MLCTYTVLQCTITYLVDWSRQVTVAADTLDIWQVLVPLHQSLLILMLLPLSWQQCAHLHTGLGLQHMRYSVAIPCHMASSDTIIWQQIEHACCN